MSLEEYPPYISSIDCRDPKIWKEGDIYYTLVVGMHEDGHGRMLLYKSLDCLKWTFVSIFFEDKSLGEMWECPDYFAYGDKDVVIVNPCKMVATKDEYHGGFNTIIFVGKRD
ncbi:MAG: hypothetical protein KBT48_11370 [Firmicutes bacterium]|nr:hypothetical protein [Bacillota bacterium]